MASRLIIFDFDGTLADTFGEIVESVNAAQREFSVSGADAETVRSWIGYGLRFFMEQALGSTDAASVEAFTATYKRLYRRIAFDRARLFDGVLGVLDALRDDVLAVASNKSEEQLVPMLERLNIRDRFSAVVGGDTAVAPKPDPVVFDAVMQSVSGPVDGCWMVGDSEPDIEFGRAIGAKTVGCLWGLRTRVELEAVEPDHIVGTRAELKTVLVK
ncbi:MAG: HAD family hydrolase [Myxococcota bacterium]